MNPRGLFGEVSDFRHHISFIGFNGEVLIEVHNKSGRKVSSGTVDSVVLLNAAERAADDSEHRTLADYMGREESA